MKSLSGTLSTILFLGAAVARAQAPPPAPTPPPIWSGDASVSFVQTTGNSQNRSLGAGLNLVYQNAPWKAAFPPAFIETKADDVETSRRFNAALRGERAFSERVAAYGQVLSGLGQITAEAASGQAGDSAKAMFPPALLRRAARYISNAADLAGSGGNLPAGVPEAARGELAAAFRRDADRLITVTTTA